MIGTVYSDGDIVFDLRQFTVKFSHENGRVVELTDSWRAFDERNSFEDTTSRNNLQCSIGESRPRSVYDYISECLRCPRIIIGKRSVVRIVIDMKPHPYRVFVAGLHSRRLTGRYGSHPSANKSTRTQFCIRNAIQRTTSTLHSLTDVLLASTYYNNWRRTVIILFNLLL